MALPAEDAADRLEAPDDDPRAEIKRKKNKKLGEQLARRRDLMKQQEAERKLPLQILFILLNSIGVAAVLSMLAALALRNWADNGILSDPEFSRFILFMTFILGFFLTLLLLVRRLPPNWWKMAEDIVNTPKFSVPEAKWGGVLDQKQKYKYEPLFDMSRAAPPAPATLEPKAIEAPFAPEPDDADRFADAIPPAPAATAPDDAPAPAPTAGAAAAEAQRQAAEHLDKFAATVATAMAPTARTLDSLGKFAIQLFLAGGCSALARRFMLSAKEAFALAVKGQALTGTPRVFAESFAANAESFAQRPGYRVMIEAGQLAMEAQLGGDAASPDSVGAAVAAWTNDENKALAPRIVTFLITDIADAAGLAQRLGNLQAQRVVRAHNQAVRGAIAKFGGAELRNSSDGALATFPDPEKAVAAAREIQQKLAAHNAATPHLSANVRIGLHAGEAASDEKGYFGAAIVSLAQICQLGRAGQILVSDVIKAFCKNLPNAFNEFGGLADEMLDLPRPVYELSWSATAVDYAEIGKEGATAG